MATRGRVEGAAFCAKRLTACAGAMEPQWKPRDELPRVATALGAGRRRGRWEDAVDDEAHAGGAADPAAAAAAFAGFSFVR